MLIQGVNPCEFKGLLFFHNLIERIFHFPRHRPPLVRKESQKEAALHPGLWYMYVLSNFTYGIFMQ